jgi:hypothetical protein
MPWIVEFADEFATEFDQLPRRVRDELLAHAEMLAWLGPALGRPRVDTLKGSRYSNMKELRFRMGGLWRVAFAFDPRRRAILLVAGNKLGADHRRFYERLIATADRRFGSHLKTLRN